MRDFKKHFHLNIPNTIENQEAMGKVKSFAVI